MIARPDVAAVLARLGAGGTVARRAARIVAAGRFMDAEATLERALAASPHHPALLLQYALAAHNDGRHAEASARWERLRRAAPGEPMALCGLAATARASGALADAIRYSDEALARFPNHRTVLSEAARVAERTGRPHDALPLWRRLVERADAPAEWWRGLAHALILLGRHEEAADALRRGRYCFADDPGLLAEEGLLAMSRKDWEGAKRVWRLYQQRFPDDIVGFDGMGRAVAGADLAQDDAGAPPPPPLPSGRADVGTTEDEAARALLLRFEAIGRDCEFGLVQRRFGAEPISLLRWNTLPPERLIGALEARFEGLGDPATTSVHVDDQGLYVVEDSRWGLRLYTFVYADDTPLDAVRAKMARRLAYLRDKFFRDLADGDKTYVLTAQEPDLDIMRRLHAAMRAIGRAKLLIVTPAQAGVTIRDLGDALGLGTVSRLGLADGTWTIAFDEWLDLLALADALD